MFHDEVDQETGSNEGTDDCVGDPHGEYQEHPAVVVPEHELVHWIWDFRNAPRNTDVDDVSDQLK